MASILGRAQISCLFNKSQKMIVANFQICMTIGAGKRDPSGVYGKQFRFDNSMFIKEV